MNLSRREFLRLAAYAGAALPLLLSELGCGPLVINGDPDTGLSLGYVSGDVTADGAIVWLRADPGSKLSLHYGKDPQLADYIALDPVTVAADSDDTAKIELKGLDPHTAYYYRAALTGKKPGPIGRFVTAPKPEADEVVKFCFSGDTRESYQPFRIMDAIRANGPDFFIHLGDTIYADRGWTAQRLPEFWAKYRDNRADLASQRLFASTSAYIIWDDHEVANDYEGFHPLGAIGRKAFFDYWPVRRNAGEADRLYRSFRWGRALELFLLDGRQYRDHAHDTLLGEEQKQWLFENLAASTALFKCIATSVPFYGGGRDRWDGYPRERAQIMQAIKEKKIKGVFFISADLHYAAVTQVSGKLGLKDITTGPMAGPMNVLATGSSKRFEFFSNKTFNYGMITIDPKSTKPHAAVEILDENNETLYKSTIEIR
jgi:alkaline phosphatase D